ncbi:hypothetical protein AK830_g3599 [Neonectria ditissima]|uniref:Uncharacterized protein n=1 Tax=Neonectria ditissima TaxID=78410 RepID=A0A0N8H7W8_9HYPO|nr:hypothetical protein AK830_g3599 [Neonectria ditissima]
MPSINGGKILDPRAADLMDARGKETQKRRQEAVDRRRKEEEMKKLAQDAGTISQQRRGAGLI